MNVGPVLIDFDLDLNSGGITFYFSESVAANFSCVGFAIQNNYSHPTVLLNLTTSSPVSPFPGSASVFSDTLNSYDLNMLKLLQLGLSIQSCYISVVSALTFSAATDALVAHCYSHEIPPDQAIQVNTLVQDSVAPVCLSFGLDLNKGAIILFFDEPVDTNTLTSTSIILYASSGGNSLQLSNPASVQRFNLTSVSIYVQSSDLNQIKLANIHYPYDLLIFSANTVKDMTGNSVQGVDVSSPIQLSYFVPDTTPPNLISFSLDYSAGLLVMTFDEVVNTTSISPSLIELLSTNNVTLASTFNLSYYSYVLPSSSNAVYVDMSLYRYDALALESDQAIGENIHNVFLLISNVLDVSGNLLQNSPIVSCASLIQDTRTVPSLQSFDWSPISNHTFPITVILYFSRVLNISTFTCSDFIFVSDTTSSPTEVLPLTNSQCNISSNADSRQVSITLSPSFLNGATLIGRSQSSTYITTVASPFTKGVSGNSVARLTTPLPLGPTFSQVLLDMVKGTVTLLFSSQVDRSSFQYTSLGFYSATSSSYFYLTSGGPGIAGFSPSSPNFDSIGILTISAYDLVTLKLLTVQKNQMFALVKADAFLDSFGLPNIIIGLSNKFPISNVIPDNVPPVIQSIQLDMGGQNILFTFDEPIISSSIISSKITVQAGPSSREFVTLSNYPSTSFVAFRNTMAISLSIFDDARIKLNPSLAKNISTSYVSISFESMTDLSGNYLNEIPFNLPLQISTYKPDQTSPTLFRFDMNMQLGTMLLYFNEPVVLSSFNTSLLFIQNRIRLSDGVRLLHF